MSFGLVLSAIATPVLALASKFGNTVPNELPYNFNDAFDQLDWADCQSFLIENHIDKTHLSEIDKHFLQLLEANGYVKYIHDGQKNTISYQVTFPSTLPENDHPSRWQKCCNWFTRKISFDTRTFEAKDLKHVKQHVLNAIRKIYTQYQIKRMAFEHLNINSNSAPLLTTNQLNTTKDGATILTTKNFDTKDPDDPSGTGWLRTLTGHGDMVTSVVYDSTGRFLGSGSLDGSIKIWDAQAGHLLHTFNEGNNIYSVAFHPLINQLASGGESEVIKIWDIDNKTLLYSLTGHTGPITSIAYNSKGDRLISTSYDKTICIWNLTDRSLLHTLTGHTNYVTKAIFNPITDEIISISADDSIKIWSQDGSLLHTIPVHAKGLLDIAINPTGDKIAVVGNDNSISIISLIDWSLLQKLTDQGSDVTSVAFNLKGDKLVSGSTDDSIYIRNIADGSLQRVMTTADQFGVSSIIFNPLGEEIASGSYYGVTIKIWTAHILSSFTFTVSDIQNGQFEKISEPNKPITAFTLEEMQKGQIRFVQNGCNLSPEFKISVSNGLISSDPVAANIQFQGIPPVLIQNKLPITQGQTVTLNTNNLNATDPCIHPSLDRFIINDLQHGRIQPNDTTITLQEIIAKQVNVTHDGSCNTLSFKITVANNYGQTPSVPGGVVFSILPPVLTRNQFTLNDQENLTITTENLKADSCALPSEITFTINGLDTSVGSFVKKTGPLVPVTSFTFQDILTQQIQFVHNGKCRLPAFSVAVNANSTNNAILQSNPQPANVTINAIPRLTKNQLESSVGQTVPITANNFNSTQCDQPNENLTISITNLEFGFFSNPPQRNITTFTQGMVNKGQICFVQNGCNLPPKFKTSVSNGLISSDPVAANIQFQGIPPVLIQNKLPITQGQTVTLNTNNLNATDPCIHPSLDRFIINDLQHGRIQPNDTTITLQEIIAKQVNVTHDGSCNTLSFKITVANNYGQTPSVPGGVVFSILPPVLTRNQFTLNDQENLTITTENLKADSCALPSEITFTINGLDTSVGSFVKKTGPLVPVTSFTFQDILTQQIQFVHNGKCRLPAFSVAVNANSTNNAILQSNPQPANVTINAIPRLTKNQLESSVGQTVPITANNFNSTQCDQPNENLTISITNLEFGFFSNPPQRNITTFTQGMVNKGQICFVQNGCNLPPKFKTSVSNGLISSDPVAANIQFQGIPPVLIQNKLPITQGQTVTLNTNNLNATDPCIHPSLDRFIINDLQHGRIQPNDTTITLQEIIAKQVNVTHDGSCNTLSFKITVANNYGQTPSVPGGVVFSILPPVLTRNQFTLNDQENLTITTENLKADSCALPSEITFTINGLDTSVGSFVKKTGPLVPVTSFTFQDILIQQIQFVHNGKCRLPAFSVAVNANSTNNAILQSDPQPANVTINAIPRLTKNQLESSVGQTVPITANNFNSTQCDRPNENLTISITNLEFGFFSNPPQRNITTFTQGMVNKGTLTFTHDGSSNAPHFNTTLCDNSSSLCTSPNAARVIHHGGSTIFYWIIGAAAGLLAVLGGIGGGVACTVCCVKQHRKSQFKKASSLHDNVELLFPKMPSQKKSRRCCCFTADAAVKSPLLQSINADAYTYRRYS